jgi:uncharacterized repeat protein (TIGR01451 family)
MKIQRSLTALILSFGFLFIVILLLGGSLVPIAQAAPTQSSLTINDVSLREGNSGAMTFTFVVSLSEPAGVGGVTFDIATQDGTATTADNDYVAKSLTGQTISEGSSTYTFDVLVNGDAVVEPNETFFVNVTNVTSATVADGQGIGTIIDDDAIADLVITKIASPEPAIAGTSLFYTITVANHGTLTATNVVVSDTLPPSATLTTVDQTDDDGGVLGFGGGTHQNTHWIDPRPAVNGDEWLTLIDPLAATGVFTSRAIDAGNVVSWTSLAWTPQRPYGKPLPNNRGVEAAYPLGDANMRGDRVLLHLDETAGSTVFTDTSGLNHNGVCPAIAGESCPTAGAAGRFNQALSFDGSLSQTVTISDAVDPVRYAIELWVNPAVVTDTSFVLRTDAVSGTTTNYSQLLGISGNRFVHLLNDGGVKAITSTTIVTPNTWYHVVGTAESNGDMKLYVNGELQVTLNGVGSVWAGGDQYRLGSALGSSV